MKLFAFVILFIGLFSCSHETITKKEKKKTFLNHEILNDSIHYKIKEYELNNSTLRNVCVFKYNDLLEEKLIYKIQKNYLRDEGYNTTFDKVYFIPTQNKIQILDITTHYFDYNIESIDTLKIDVIITPSSKIKTKKI